MTTRAAIPSAQCSQAQNDGAADSRSSAKALILVAEDEETEVILLQLAMKKAGLPNPVFFTRDGQETISYLKGEAQYSDRQKHPFPALLILDLKMPRLTGFDVLAWLGQSQQPGNIPAVVLTSSSHDQDITRARELGAREYHVKPHSVKDLAKLMAELAGRWLAPGS